MPILIQRAMALLALILLSPLIALLALAVRLTSRGPAFHGATRVRPGGTFTLYKLRSMTSDAEAQGAGVTAQGDFRVTQLGRSLRRTKLDELPQLWNVVRGDMALVGPRPEDPRFVDLSDPLHARVFGALPGITGPTALAYRAEETELGSAASDRAAAGGRANPARDDIEAAYREVILPAKLLMDAEYLGTRSFRGDLRILLATVRTALRSGPSRR